MKTILLVGILMLIALAGAESDAYICDKAFFLLIEDKGIEELREKVGNVSEEYMINYSYVCKDFRKLPNANLESNSSENLTLCQTNMNQEILWGFFDLDSSISIPFSFMTNKMSCDSVNNWKKILRMKNVNNGFMVDGLRLWFVIASLSLVGFIIILRAVTVGET